ncbi:hypothetical protein JXB31_01760 [Candidatus Woesearchaeota archaeon]|nr:hypothetical protein [Candidatus Woesearchaeota archaeon]
MATDNTGNAENAGNAEKRADEKLIIRYDGPAEDFRNRYLDYMAENGFNAERYIENKGWTIVIMGYTGLSESLDDKVMALKEEGLGVEYSRVYRTMGSGQVYDSPGLACPEKKETYDKAKID